MSDPTTDPDVLFGLIDVTAGEPLMDIRLANHPNMPAAGLRRLAGHEFSAVRTAVAQNQNSSEATVRELANDRVWFVRFVAAASPLLSAEEARVAIKRDTPVQLLLEEYQDTIPALIHKVGMESFLRNVAVDEHGMAWLQKHT